MSTRVCKVCGIEKQAVKGEWVTTRGNPVGKTCSKCSSLRSALWAKNNPSKANARNSRWQKVHAHIHTVNTRKHQSIKAKRMPHWLSTDDILQIKSMYLFAKIMEECTGEKHHVDHIIPLSSKCVSGLHVPYNLQVLSSKQNLIKGNKHGQEA